MKINIKLRFIDYHNIVRSGQLTIFFCHPCTYNRWILIFWCTYDSVVFRKKVWKCFNVLTVRSYQNQYLFIYVLHYYYLVSICIGKRHVNIHSKKYRTTLNENSNTFEGFIPTSVWAKRMSITHSIIRSKISKGPRKNWDNKQKRNCKFERKKPQQQQNFFPVSHLKRTSYINGDKNDFLRRLVSVAA